MRGRRFYGGGSGFLLCFAAERKRCAPESLFQLPLLSHTLLREKDTVQHNGNRAVTAFLFPNAFVGKGGCAPGFLHCLALCTALLSARSAMPCAQKFAAVLLTVSCAFSERATPKGRFTLGICRISLRTFREASSRKGQGYGMSAAAVPCASRRRDFRKVRHILMVKSK